MRVQLPPSAFFFALCGLVLLGAAPSPDIALYDTPAWTDTIAGLLTRDTPDHQLLITVQNWEQTYAKRGHGAVYQYQPADRTFGHVADFVWDDSPEPVIDCSSQSDPALALDPGAEQLSYHDQPIRPRGQVILHAAPSPDHGRIAVLSANGPRSLSVLPFLGGGANSSGQHYHEVFTMAGAKSGSSEAMALPFTTQEVAYTGCWSADNRFVIYADAIYRHLVVVPVQ